MPQLRSQIASLERNVADSEAALTSERTNAATLRQRITELTTQLEVAHASQSSTAENATAASSRVAELSKKLGDANEEVNAVTVRWCSHFRACHAFDVFAACEVAPTAG